MTGAIDVRTRRVASAAVDEVLGARQLARLLWRSPALLRAPRGSGRPVLVLPGRGTDDVTTLPLRRYLGRLGHDPHGWGLGRNDGDIDRLVPGVLARLATLVAVGGGPVPVIGQSLGGTIARVAARESPADVAQIITLGSPGVRFGGDHLPVPLTAIYSRSDRVVPPHLALAGTDGAEVIEVGSTHHTMGLDPDVWTIIAERLAEEPT